MLYGYLLSNNEVVCRHCATDDDINAGAREVIALAEHAVCSRCGLVLQPCVNPAQDDNGVIGYLCECGRWGCGLAYYSSQERGEIQNLHGGDCFIRWPGCPNLDDGEYVVEQTPRYKVIVEDTPLVHGVMCECSRCVSG